MVSIMIKILRCGTCRQSFEASPIELKLYSAIIYKFEWFSEFYTLAYQIMTYKNIVNTLPCKQGLFTLVIGWWRERECKLNDRLLKSLKFLVL